MICVSCLKLPFVAPPLGFVDGCGRGPFPSSTVHISPEQIADEDRGDQHDPDDDDGPIAFHPRKGESALQRLHEKQAEHGPDDRAAAAEDAGAAEHDCGDDVKLEPGSHVRPGGRYARHEDDGGESCDEA